MYNFLYNLWLYLFLSDLHLSNYCYYLFFDLNLFMLSKYKIKYEFFKKRYNRFFNFLYYLISFMLVLVFLISLIYVVFWIGPALYNLSVVDFKKICNNFFNMFFNNVVSTVIRSLLMRHRRLFWGIHDEFFDVDDLRWERPVKKKNFRKHFRHVFRLTRHKNWRRTWRFRDLVMRFEFFFNLRERKSFRKLGVHMRNFFEDRVHVYKFTFRRGLTRETVKRWWKAFSNFKRFMVKVVVKKVKKVRQEVKKPKSPFVYQTLYGVMKEKIEAEKKRWKEEFWTSIIKTFRTQLILFFEVFTRVCIFFFLMTLLAYFVIDYLSRTEIFSKPFWEEPLPLPEPEVTKARVKVYKAFIKDYYASFNKKYKYRRPFTKQGKFLYFFKAQKHPRKLV